MTDSWPSEDDSQNQESRTFQGKFWVQPTHSNESSRDVSMDPSRWLEDSNGDDKYDARDPLVGIQDDKRRQTKLLLVSLIEMFCRIHSDTPEANRRTFFLICQTLRSIGVIDAEFVDEIASVRSAFQQAFKKLFFSALQTVRGENTKGIEGNIPKLITAASSSSYSMESVESTMTSLSDRSRSLGIGLNVQNSRYRDDFVEIDMLGRGGFGSAWRARNKLDGIEYAIKKVPLKKKLSLAANQKGDNPYEKILREIKHLARLEHPKVIRYYGSWLEYDTSSDHRSSASEFSEEGSSMWLSRDYQSRSLLAKEASIGIEPSSIYDSHLVAEVESISDERSNNKDQGQLVSRPRRVMFASEVLEADRDSDDSGWTLFIQMQMCSATLYDYIQQRNLDIQKNSDVKVDHCRDIDIFLQIVQGIVYVHAQGLIHRDMKPSNIFLSSSKLDHKNKSKSSCDWRDSDWTPKIGDFGLAAATFNEDDIKDGKLKRSRTIGVGTKTYASPEQLAIPALPYDEKVDIYSLGIIFFELCWPFTTGMERAMAVEKLRQGTLPDGFVDIYPEESALILWMTSESPADRPSAEQLLEFVPHTKLAKLPTPNPLHTELCAKDEEIAKLKKQIELLQLENEKMQQRLACKQDLNHL